MCIISKNILHNMDFSRIILEELTVSDADETYISRPKRGETFEFRDQGEAIGQLDFEARRDISKI